MSTAIVPTVDSQLLQRAIDQIDRDRLVKLVMDLVDIPSPTGFEGDVAREADIVAMFDAAEKALGPVTGLVNSAGISIKSAVRDFAAADLERLMAVNVNGVYLGCRHVIPIMRRQGGGVIERVGRDDNPGRRGRPGGRQRLA